MFLAILTLVIALLISATAAYFSIAGLAALFSATALGVVIMGIVLESGKLVAAGWIHHNWRNPRVTFLHRAYLCLAIGSLMIITSLGIYGYLSKGHLEQQAPKAGIELQLTQGDQRIQQLEANNARLTTRLNQLDQSVDVFLKNEKASQGLRARNNQKTERAEINAQIDANNAAIQEIQNQLLPLKTQNLEVEAKLGPVKYFAKAFGLQDEAAVNIVILLIMTAFDPLAIVLVISGTISLEQALERKRKAAMAKTIEENDRIVSEEVLEKQKDVEEQATKVKAEQEQVAEARIKFVSETEEIRSALERDRVHLNTKSETLRARQLALETTESEIEERQTELLTLEEALVEQKAALDAREAEIASWEPIIDDAKKSEKDRILAMLEANPGIIEDILDIVEEANRTKAGDTE